ncbi:hypothetical protein H4R27_004255 [Coemansia aciculifera]|nr:hypothetical protein H4R27_004255 [Coemansia aciculifera]
MTGTNNFSQQDQYTIKASASKASTETSTREDTRSAPSPTQQSIQDLDRGLSISGQSKSALKNSSDDTATGFKRSQAQQQASKVSPSIGLVIAGQSSSTQQSKPKDKSPQQQHSKGQPDEVSRKRASSSATLEIVGAAPQPKSRHQQQHRPAPTKPANISGGGFVSISGTAETPPASKLDVILPPSHTQQEASDGADAKRLKISGGRKKRSLFGYRMEALLMDNNRSASYHELQSQPRAVDSAKTADYIDNSPPTSGQSTVVIQTTPEQRPVGLAIASTHTSTAVSNDSDENELIIARSATGIPGTDQRSNHAAPYSLRIANSSAEHNVSSR